MWGDDTRTRKYCNASARLVNAQILPPAHGCATLTFSMRYSFTLAQKTYEVRSEKELALIFGLLKESGRTADTLHWEILMQLDWRLMEVIKTYTGLLECLQHLSDKNRFLLIIKIGDTLPDVVESAERLGNIIAGIPEEKNKVQLIKILRKKGLQRLIFNARDLAYVIEWTYEEAEKILLETLEPSFINQIVTTAQHAYDVMRFITAYNKGLFVDMIGFGRLRALIQSPQDLFYLLKMLPVEDAKRFLAGTSRREVVGIIRTDKAFHEGLRSLALRKEKILLDFLGLPPIE